MGVVNVACQNCGQSVAVDSLLSAAQQPCPHCGHELMGPTAAPEWQITGEAVKERRTFSRWCNVIIYAGAAVGTLGAAAAALASESLPLAFINAVVGGLAGVVVGPLVLVVILAFLLSAYALSTFQYPYWETQLFRGRHLPIHDVPDLLTVFVNFIVGGLNSQDKTDLFAFTAYLGLVLGAIFGMNQTEEPHIIWNGVSLLGGAILGKNVASFVIRVLAR
jgi:hypothetical protein